MDVIHDDDKNVPPIMQVEFEDSKMKMMQVKQKDLMHLILINLRFGNIQVVQEYYYKRTRWFNKTFL